MIRGREFCVKEKPPDRAERLSVDGLGPRRLLVQMSHNNPPSHQGVARRSINRANRDE